MKGTLLGVLIVFAQAMNMAQAEGKVVCYYFRYSDLPIDLIDPMLCSHINFAFVGLTAQGDITNEDPSGFAQLNALRLRNPMLKTLVAVGGGDEGSERFSPMVADPNTRAAFVRNAVDFVQQYDLDGMDLDWEYPAQRGGSPADVDNFVLLLREIREAFDQNGLLLTAAVSAVRSSMETSFGQHIPEISGYLDFINVMTYDFHGNWFPVTGQTAPLYASSIDTTEEQRLLNVVAGIDNWITQGADRSKLILGIATYGNTFTLVDAANNGLGAPALQGQGPNGGAYRYNQICAKLQEGGWSDTWDDEQKVPYMTRDTEWVGYDNQESIKYKVSYGISQGLGGAMIWHLGSDDFEGNCHGRTYPLLRTINEELGNNVQG